MVLMSAGAVIAIQGGVNQDGFYHGSFEGKEGLVPAGFVQEMAVEDSQQRKRLLNQTLSRPHLSSLHSPHHTPLSPRSSPASPTPPSPFTSLLTHTPFLHSTGNTMQVYSRDVDKFCIFRASVRMHKSVLCLAFKRIYIIHVHSILDTTTLII